MKIETKDQIVITGLAKKGGAFGLVLPDLDESVYIGVRIFEQSGAKLLDKCDAVLTDNRHPHSHTIPYVAAYVRVVEAEPEAHQHQSQRQSLTHTRRHWATYVRPSHTF